MTCLGYRCLDDFSLIAPVRAYWEIFLLSLLLSLEIVLGEINLCVLSYQIGMQVLFCIKFWGSHSLSLSLLFIVLNSWFFGFGFAVAPGRRRCVSGFDKFLVWLELNYSFTWLEITSIFCVGTVDNRWVKYGALNKTCTWHLFIRIFSIRFL